jgi:hypothetical protein
MADQETKPAEREWKPIPDPTVLTTQALAVAIQALEEKLTARQEGMREAIEARLQAMDKANHLAEETVTRVPTLLDRARQDIQVLFTEKIAGISRELMAMSELRDEKFVAIKEQFAEKDRAVSAAFASAEKAGDKQAASFAGQLTEVKGSLSKQVEQLSELLRATSASLDDKINDAKDRLNRIEGQAVGKLDVKSESHLNSSIIVSIIATLIAAAAFFSRFLGK